MADISAITALDGVTYSIKDSEAREHLVPTGGTAGQVLTKTASGEAWQTPSGGGNVDTVNSIQPDANKNVQTVVELTQAQYDALVSPDPNVVYYITDGSTSYPTADEVRYEEGVSVADALDELNAGLTDYTNYHNGNNSVSVGANTQTVVNTYTITKSGLYYVEFSQYFGNNANARFGVYIGINGNYERLGVIFNGGNASASLVKYLSVGDVVTGIINPNTALSNTNSDRAISYLSVQFIK